VKSERLEWSKTKSDKTKSHGKPSNVDGDSCSSRKTRQWIKRSKYRRIQKQKKKQKISVVFNYSKIELTPAMEKVLNRGLNFAILPLKLNMTQVLVDYNRFERTMLWQEFWANSPKTDYKPPIFKKVKTNLPQKHPAPPGLKVFLNGVKSEIMDPQNRNKSRPNLPPDEIDALSQLIKLQKNQTITIKPFDKGAGVIILDFDEYFNDLVNTTFNLNRSNRIGLIHLFIPK
jgi:hypothetical protein